MQSIDFFGDKKVVNVASVPQLSPFRYPGGKTWLIPYIRRWFQRLARKPKLLVEPFAGGGIVSLTAAFENLAERVLMVELDEQVASVWRVITGNDAEWLVNRILSFDLTKEAVARELAKSAVSLNEAAFQTILRNRTNHGGIMAPGSGSIQHGENGKGIGSRWYPATLSKRIRDIGKVKDKIEFVQGDGLAVIGEHREAADAVFFIDPPYTAAGKKAGTRLYIHNVVDHEALFNLASTLRGDFLMTYDNAAAVRAMAVQHRLDFETIPMKNTHHANMTELLIGRDLRWTRA